MFSKYLKISAIAFCMLILNACSAAPPRGAASFTLISDQTDKNRKHYSSAGSPVEGKDCLNFPLFMMFGKPPTEETLLARVLEENNADALIDAELKYSFVYAFIFMRSCLTVSGTPVKLKKTL